MRERAKTHRDVETCGFFEDYERCVLAGTARHAFNGQVCCLFMPVFSAAARGLMQPSILGFTRLMISRRLGKKGTGARTS